MPQFIFHFRALNASSRAPMFLWIPAFWTIKLTFSPWKSNSYLMLQTDSTIVVDINLNFSLIMCWSRKSPESRKVDDKYFHVYCRLEGLRMDMQSPATVKPNPDCSS